jgi:hypothetical protein
VSGKLFLNKTTLGGSLGSNFDTYHLYGYKSLNTIPEANTLEQKLSDYVVNFSLVDNDTQSNFYYKVGLGAHFFEVPNLSWKEKDVFANISLDFDLIDHLKIKSISELHFSNQNTATTTNPRVFVKIKPYVVYPLGALNLEAGAGFYSLKDSINGYENKFYITPHVVARYALASGQMLSAGIRGDVIWQSARTRFAKNPYLGINTVINNQVKPVEIFLEANGKLTTKLDFSLAFKTSFYKVFGQFVNNALDQATFNIDYNQDNNSIHHINGQIDYIALKNLIFSAYGNYAIFSFKNIENPYHIPKVNLGVKTRFVLEDKFDTELSLAYLDGIYAFDNDSLSDIKLHPILDINMVATYKINTLFSVFVKMHNIVGNKYQYYYNYPTKGFQVLGGISLSL